MNQQDHEYMHAHGIAHDHDHDHAHDHDHDHDHAHDHDHDHDHEHAHDHAHCEGQPGCDHNCTGCNDPRAELIALMRYMVNHNAAHANELAQLAGKLRDMGEGAAYEQVMQAVSDFEKGNVRLTAVLAAMQG